jgi:hypothetical protein
LNRLGIRKLAPGILAPLGQTASPAQNVSRGQPRTQGDKNMNAKVWLSMLALLLGPGMAAAQKIDRPKNPDAGDTATFNWVLNNKPQQVKDEWTGGDGDEVRGIQRVGDKQIALALGKEGFELRRSMCFSNGQPCIFSPGLKFAEFPLEKGKKWSSTFNVKGETFVADVSYERKVDKVEKVRVPAGEYEAFKVSHRGRITGTDAQGKKFNGNEEATDWFALVNGKLALIKTTYRNSFGEKFNRELTSIRFQ